jgi:nitrite reductase/ring-hydroxylating ferredoxin subunit
MAPSPSTASNALTVLRAVQSLSLAGVYRRVVNASLTRVWENVFDWEHLPALHDAYFNRIELLQRNPIGWRVRLTRQPGDPSRLQVIHLVADRSAGDYCVQTLEGVGTGSQIWTHLAAVEPHGTSVEVSYLVPEQRPDRLAILGEKYRSMYQRLWDEDEAMMRHREFMLAQHRRPTSSHSVSVSLGHISEVRARLPLIVSFADQPFRVLELEGELVAHSTICPHWLGPLDQAAVLDGCIRCPWHGYQFDVRTGASSDGRSLHLASNPHVHVSDSGEVTLISPEGALANAN